MRALLRHHWVRKVHLLPARGILSHIHGPFQAHRSPIRGCMRPLKLQMAWKQVSRLLQRCSHFEGSGWTMSITILRKVCNYPNQVSRVFWCQGPLFLHIFFFQLLCHSHNPNAEDVLLHISSSTMYVVSITVSAKIVPDIHHPQFFFVQQKGLTRPWSWVCSFTKTVYSFQKSLNCMNYSFLVICCDFPQLTAFQRDATLLTLW